MKRPENLDEFNAYLETWNGSRVFLNSYINYDDGLDRLRVVIEKRDQEKTGTWINIIGCIFLSGPTSWLNCNLKCRISSTEGELGFEVFDDSNGFLVRCLESIVVGAGEIFVYYNNESYDT